jgi:hypothetical protein
MFKKSPKMGSSGEFPVKKGLQPNISGPNSALLGMLVLPSVKGH